MSNLDTQYRFIELDLIEEKKNDTLFFNLSDVDTSDFFIKITKNKENISLANYKVVLYVIKPSSVVRDVVLRYDSDLKAYYCDLSSELKNIVGTYTAQCMVIDESTGEKKGTRSQFKYQIESDILSKGNQVISETVASDILNRVIALEQGSGGTGASIDDNVTSINKTWSSNKIAQQMQQIVLQNGNTTFQGKTATFYGDSLTNQNYHYTKGYHSWIKDILGLTSYQNFGTSGFKLSDIYNKVNSTIATGDIIFVMGGVNDQNNSVALGQFGDNTTSSIYGSLNLLCAKLKEKYPTKLIVFLTPHYQTKYPHSAGITSYEVSKAVKEVCEKHTIPVYDNFILSGIYSTNLSTFTTDNCHWNDIAHEKVGKNLAKWMLSNFAYLYLESTPVTPDPPTPTTSYSITNNLINAINSNTVSTVEEGTSYNATITAVEGYELSNVTVTMGDVDITTSAVIGNSINITNVTGDVVITATTTESNATTVNFTKEDFVLNGIINDNFAYENNSLIVSEQNKTFSAVYLNDLKTCNRIKAYLNDDTTTNNKWLIYKEDENNIYFISLLDRLGKLWSLNKNTNSVTQGDTLSTTAVNKVLVNQLITFDLINGMINIYNSDNELVFSLESNSFGFIISKTTHNNPVCSQLEFLQL